MTTGMRGDAGPVAGDTSPEDKGCDTSPVVCGAADEGVMPAGDTRRRGVTPALASDTSPTGGDTEDKEVTPAPRGPPGPLCPLQVALTPQPSTQNPHILVKLTKTVAFIPSRPNPARKCHRAVPLPAFGPKIGQNLPFSPPPLNPPSPLSPPKAGKVHGSLQKSKKKGKNLPQMSRMWAGWEAKGGRKGLKHSGKEKNSYF